MATPFKVDDALSEEYGSLPSTIMNQPPIKIARPPLTKFKTDSVVSKTKLAPSSKRPLTLGRTLNLSTRKVAALNTPKSNVKIDTKMKVIEKD